MQRARALKINGGQGCTAGSTLTRPCALAIKHMGGSYPHAASSCAQILLPLSEILVKRLNSQQQASTASFTESRVHAQ